MRTVHTELVQARRLAVGDSIVATKPSDGTMLPHAIVSIGETRLGGPEGPNLAVGVECGWTIFLAPGSIVPIVVSDHSESSLFAPDGALF